MEFVQKYRIIKHPLTVYDELNQAERVGIIRADLEKELQTFKKPSTTVCIQTLGKVMNMNLKNAVESTTSVYCIF